tara:strand:+ start:22 stop:165 length:144 start_codon:yes stop_codon:yes gene_type:complete
MRQKIIALIELIKGFWHIFIIGRDSAQFKHWYTEWWLPNQWRYNGND